MRTFVQSSLTLVPVVVLAFAGAARAQNIEEALKQYQDREYENAAILLYDVLANDANPDRRDQAQTYLAETLRKMGFGMSAFYYYESMFQAGSANRYYLNAVEGLLAIQVELHDQLFIPDKINNGFDADAFRRLDRDKAEQINFLVGQLSHRRGKYGEAERFLAFVPPESAYFARARYLLGVVAVSTGDMEKALGHFKFLSDLLEKEAKTDEDKRMRNLSYVAAGRAAYTLGRYQESADYFARVPRFSDEWFSALYESAWAYYQLGDFGRALGALESVTSPYFAKRYIPEAYVIQGTAFFSSCQWDRVRRAVEAYKKGYEEPLKQLQGYLAERREPFEYYRDMVADGGGKYAAQIAREVRRIRRIRDHHYVTSRIKWEREQLSKIPEWANSRLAKDLELILDDQFQAAEAAAGADIANQLKSLDRRTKGFQDQMSILDFELVDSEAQWLQEGREILKGRRARLPRPDVPSDQWQHWSRDREYWKDELGYYQHTIRSECN